MENHIPIKNKLGSDQFFKISRFKEKIKKTKPHKHDGYCELIYIQDGEGFHWLDTDYHRISAPEIYFLKPGSLHCWQFTAIPKGFVLLFKEDYFDPIKEQNILNLLQKMDLQMRIALPDEYNPLPIFEEIFREYSQGHDQAGIIIRGFLQAILSKMIQYSKGKHSVRIQNSGLPDRFLKLLSRKSLQWNLVHQYASQLNTSPQNLNAACRKNTGKTAGEHIAAQRLLEAKRFILHTEKNITEISYLLNFNDASYFIKFFKKHTGLTPIQFRRAYFQ